MPKPQTVASAKYQKKVGLVSKAYKLDSGLTKEFKAACDAAGVSQAAQISKMMREFIASQNKIK